VRVKLWGVRGSIPVPGEAAAGYGGNTSCVGISAGADCEVILDAGSGIRGLGAALSGSCRHVHVLLTHLHLDHIQGLLFFEPLFHAESTVTIWGPSAPGRSLQSRIGRYLSAPLTPLDVRELPCQLDFRNCPVAEWNIGPARIRAETVTHRGPTLGFRIEDGGTSLCYLPDHEPALVGDLADLEPEWISGYSLAYDVDLLLHDCQYTDGEYPAHMGWGHSALSHTLQFAHRCAAHQTLLFHHDPSHTDDDLDEILKVARERWAELGEDPGTLAMASERLEIAWSGAPVAK
jgi:phosphoribosyl 1,2-cyclic phosphodiesterase